MDTSSTITHIGLCAGYGGIELGLQRVIRNLRTVALCEIEAFACANLVAKMEAGLLDCAPIWTDLKTFPWAEFRDRVDILTGGYPCQPFSAAGKRLGTEDPRHLWPHIQRSISIIRPRLCFFENVEGHISLGLSSVISDLEELGYKVSWGIFSASEVGAPHQRKRVFILAHRIGDGHYWRELQDRMEGWASSQLSQPHAGESCGVWGETGRCGQVWPSRPGEQQFAWEPPRVVADSKKSGRISERVTGNLDGSEGSQGGGGDQSAPASADCGDAGAAEAMGNAASQRPGTLGAESAGQQRQASTPGAGDAMGNASQRQDHGRESRDLGLAPSQRGSGDHASDGAGEVLGHPDSPRPQERPRQRGAGLQGTDTDGGADAGGQTKSPMGRDADGPAGGLDHAELYTTCDNRTDELRLLGNGVVPATAERAFLTLWEELFQQQPTN